MDTVAGLLAVFLAIPEAWPGWIRAVYYLGSPVLYPLWLVSLVIGALGYALVCVFGLLILAVIEFPAVCQIIAVTVREGGAESYEVMENVGRVPAE